MATAETHDVLIRWKQEGQQAVTGQVNAVKKSFAGISAAAKQTGTIMSAAVTGPLVLLAKNAISAASDLNESMSAVKTVFGDSSDEVIKFSQNAATALGQSQQDALSAASGLGALFQSIGLNNGAMADFSDHLLQASADLGSFFNVDPTEAMDALKSGLVGESEPLRKFGILLSDAQVQAEGVKEGLIETGGTMTDQQKVIARYNLIMGQLGAAQGDFARTSDGLANSQRTLGAEFQDLQADIGTLLLPTVKDLVAQGKNLLGWIRNLSPEAKDLAVKIGLIAAAAGPALVVISQIGPVLAALASGPFLLAAGAAVALYKAWDSNFANIRDTLQILMGNVGTVVGRMVEFFTHAKERGLAPFELAIRTMIQGVKSVLGDDNPVVDFLKGIERNGRRLASYVTGELIPDLRGIIYWISEGDIASAGHLAELLVQGIKDGWDRTFGAFLDELNAFGPTFLSKINDSFNGLNWDLIFIDVQKKAKESSDRYGLFDEIDFQGMVDQLIENTRQELDWFRNLPQLIQGNTASGDWDSTGAAMEAYGISLARSLWTNTQEELSQIKNAAQWVLDQLAGADWESIGVDQNNRGSQIAQKLVDGFHAGTDALQSLTTWVNDTLSTLDWTDVQNTLRTAGEDSLGQLLQGFGNKMADIAAWFSGGAQGGGGQGEGFGNRVLGLLSGSLASVQQQVTDSGAAVIQWFIDGLDQKWTDLQQWFTDHNPGDLIPSGWFNVNPDPNAPENNPDSSRATRAFGGPGNGWAWVGEAGPELVKLPLGSMVIPHPASMTRALAMAQGGVVGLTRDDLRGSVRGLSPRELARLIAYMKSYGGDETQKGFVDRARQLERRFFGGANVTGDNLDHLVARGFSRHGSGDRQAFDDPSWRRRHGRTPWDEITDPSSRGDRHVTVYGNVHIYPSDADVAGEISRQYSNRNRV